MSERLCCARSLTKQFRFSFLQDTTKIQISKISEMRLNAMQACAPSSTNHEITSIIHKVKLAPMTWSSKNEKQKLVTVLLNRMTLQTGALSKVVSKLI